MKTIFLVISFTVLAFTACGQNAKKNAQESEKSTAAARNDVVNVYYFHGKQRCKTCIAVGKVAQQTVKDLANPKVQFIEVQTDDKASAALVEKYHVTWNALIVARGGQSTDITKQAFANAVNNPQALTDLIKTEVDKKLAQ